MKLPVLSQYTVWLKVAALVLAFIAGGYCTRLYYKAAIATEREQIARDAFKQIQYWQLKAYESDEALDKALKSAPKSRIREVVRENHSDCVRPPAVDKRLRDALRDGNAAISG